MPRPEAAPGHAALVSKAAAPAAAASGGACVKTQGTQSKSSAVKTSNNHSRRPIRLPLRNESQAPCTPCTKPTAHGLPRTATPAAPHRRAPPPRPPPAPPWPPPPAPPHTGTLGTAGSKWWLLLHTGGPWGPLRGPRLSGTRRLQKRGQVSSRAGALFIRQGHGRVKVHEKTALPCPALPSHAMPCRAMPYPSRRPCCHPATHHPVAHTPRHPPTHPPAKLSVRQTYMPCAFMSIATNSKAAMLPPLDPPLPCASSGGVASTATLSRLGRVDRHSDAGRGRPADFGLPPACLPACQTCHSIPNTIMQQPLNAPLPTHLHRLQESPKVSEGGAALPPQPQADHVPHVARLCGADGG